MRENPITQKQSPFQLYTFPYLTPLSFCHFLSLLPPSLIFFFLFLQQSFSTFISSIFLLQSMFYSFYCIYCCSINTYLSFFPFFATHTHTHTHTHTLKLTNAHYFSQKNFVIYSFHSYLNVWSFYSILPYPHLVQIFCFFLFTCLLVHISFIYSTVLTYE